jgi:hypothetical protein
MMDEQTEEKLRQVTGDICELLRGNNLQLSQAAGVLGGVMGYLVTQSELNDPFISFFNSFTHTFNANYKGPAPMTRTRPLKINEEE